MPLVVTAWFAGTGVRAPDAEKRMVLQLMRSLDTEEQVVEVPWHVAINGLLFFVDWCDIEPGSAPDDALDFYYNDDGRCAKCGKLEGDHLHPWFKSTPKSACTFTPKLSRTEMLRAKIILKEPVCA